MLMQKTKNLAGCSFSCCTIWNLAGFYTAAHHELLSGSTGATSKKSVSGLITCKSLTSSLLSSSTSTTSKRLRSGEPIAQFTLMLASELNFPFGFVAARIVVLVFSLQTRPAFATLGTDNRNVRASGR